MPVFIVEFHVITAIVIPRPARFLAEHRVMRHGLGGQNPVLQFPRSLQLVQILSPLDNVDLLAVQLVYDVLDAAAADPHAGTDAVDLVVDGLHGDLGAVAWVAGQLLDVDDSLDLSSRLGSPRLTLSRR